MKSSSGFSAGTASPEIRIVCVRGREHNTICLAIRSRKCLFGTIVPSLAFADVNRNFRFDSPAPLIIHVNVYVGCVKLAQLPAAQTPLDDPNDMAQAARRRSAAR